MEKVRIYNVKIYKVFRYRRLRHEWVWKVTASNGKVIGKSTESYVNKSDCIYNVRSLGRSLIYGDHETV